MREIIICLYLCQEKLQAFLIFQIVLRYCFHNCADLGKLAVQVCLKMTVKLRCHFPQIDPADVCHRAF